MTVLRPTFRPRSDVPKLLSALVTALVFGAFAVRADDWPHWRGPHGNGLSSESRWSTQWPAEGPRPLWKASVGTGFSSVAVARGRLFTLGNKEAIDTVYAFDAAGGKELWKHTYPCPLDPEYYEGGPGSTPTVDGDHVFTLSKRGHLFCFEAATGKIIWQKNLMEDLGLQKPRWGFAGSPLVEGNLLLLNAGSAGTALDKATGNVVWVSGKEKSGYATPVPFDWSGERAVAIFAAKALVGVRVKDGQELWRHPWTTGWDINAADPIRVGPDQWFISSFDRGAALLRVIPSGITVVWENKEMGNHFNSCVFANGHLFGVNGNSDKPDRDLRCLDARTGAVKWKETGYGLGSLTMADGRLIVLGEKGELAVAPASPEGFKPISKAQVLGGKCWTVPVLANGRIYCRNAQGNLVCLDVKGK